MQHSLPILIFVALIIFSMYRRVRRTVTWQPFVVSRLMWRIVVFAVIGVLLGVQVVMVPNVLAYSVLGIVIGAVVGYIGMRTTTLRQGPNGLQYRANPWIGSIIIVLFLARLIDRIYVMAQLTRSLPHTQATSTPPTAAMYGRDPLLFATIYLIFAYYIVYYLLLWRKVKRGKSAPNEWNQSEANP